MDGVRLPQAGALGIEGAALKQNIIVVSDRAEPEFEDMLGQGLDEFNVQAAGLNDRRPLCVIVRDPDTDAPLGGIVGRTSLGLAFLDLFHLPASLRGAGLGRQILAAFEEEARQRGCRSAVLYTISFQAPEFYKKNGWESFGEISSDLPGVSRVFMTKKL
jgi:GNAT superfamily N-acetyltransferase